MSASDRRARSAFSTVTFVALGVLAMVASACSSGGTSEVSDAAAFDCTNPIGVVNDLDDQGADWMAAGEVTALVRADVHQRGRFVELSSGDRIWFSKIALAVRDGATFTIGGTGANPVLVDWGQGGGEPAESIRVDGCSAICSTEFEQPGCPSGGSGEWAVYPGGVWSVDVGCHELEVRTSQSTERLRLGLGEACAT